MFVSKDCRVIIEKSSKSNLNATIQQPRVAEEKRNGFYLFRKQNRIQFP